MAIWYTDIALAQIQGQNFPGAKGEQQIIQPPYQQNNPLFEGTLEMIGTYIWTGSEAANDIINVGKLEAGYIVDPNGHVASGITAPATTLTVAIGDNDLGQPTSLPVPNPQAMIAQPTNFVAPTWVSGTTYVYGNVVADATSTPAFQVFTMVSATNSGSTAPHSAANTIWMPNSQRYSNSIDIHAASGNVAFTGGTQTYGGPASIVPQSTTPGQLPVGFDPSVALQYANQQYQIQNDCWFQALLLTVAAPVANTFSVFRVSLLASN